MTPEELKAIEERCVKLRKGGLIDSEMVIQLSRLIGDVGKLLDYIKDLERAHEILSDGYDQMKAHLESQIPRWTPITVAVPDEYEIVLFKMVELVALKGEEKPMKGSDPIPDIFEAFSDTIETRTSYFTGYRVDKIYRDHLHNCVRNYVRLEWVKIFKEEES